THTLYMSSESRTNTATGLIEAPKGGADAPRYVSGNVLVGYRYVPTVGEGTAGDQQPRAGGASEEDGGGGRGGARGVQSSAPADVMNLTIQGLPLLKPPYGKVNAVNLDRGEIVWQTPHGETPDSVRNHPALKGMTIPRTGQGGTPGVLVTK